MLPGGARTVAKAGAERRVLPLDVARVPGVGVRRDGRILEGERVVELTHRPKQLRARGIGWPPNHWNPSKKQVSVLTIDTSGVC